MQQLPGGGSELLRVDLVSLGVALIVGERRWDTSLKKRLHTIMHLIALCVGGRSRLANKLGGSGHHLIVIPRPEPLIGNDVFQAVPQQEGELQYLGASDCRVRIV